MLGLICVKPFAKNLGVNSDFDFKFDKQITVVAKNVFFFFSPA